MYRIFCNSEQNSYQWIVNLVVGKTSTMGFHPPKALSHYQIFWKRRPIYVLHGHQTYENISIHLLKLQGILRKWMTRKVHRADLMCDVIKKLALFVLSKLWILVADWPMRWSCDTFLIKFRLYMKMYPNSLFNPTFGSGEKSF